MLSALLTLSGLKRKWPLLSKDEVRHHNTRNSLWIVSGDSVYDVTDILSSHPGGDLALLRRGGGSRDCTKDRDFHSRHARRQWETRKVGEIVLSEDEEDGFPSSINRRESDKELERVTQQQQSTVRETYTTTVKVAETSNGAMTLPSLSGAGLCVCPRCGRLAD